MPSVGHSLPGSSDPTARNTLSVGTEGARVRALLHAAVIEASQLHVVPVRRDGSAEEVLCELELDGATYVLSRMRPRRSTPTLSRREREIAMLVAQGLPTKAIGAALHISAWTVTTHLRRIYGKFGVRTRAAMVATLLGEGLL